MIYSIFNNLTWTDPPTHPPNHPPIHLSKGGSVSTNHKSSNRIELSQLDQVLLKFLVISRFDPLIQPINPPTYPKNTHPWVWEFSTDSKSFNGILISWFIQVLSNLYWFWGGTPLWAWVGGWVGDESWVEVPPHMCMHMHAHACTHAYTHACMLNMINMAASMKAAICNFPNMFILAFRACVCMCLGIPSHAPRCPPTHLTPPQSQQGAWITES